jgi:hypothetical protein
MRQPQFKVVRQVRERIWPHAHLTPKQNSITSTTQNPNQNKSETIRLCTRFNQQAKINSFLWSSKELTTC